MRIYNDRYATNADFPTPPDPNTTSLYSLMMIYCFMHARVFLFLAERDQHKREKEEEKKKREEREKETKERCKTLQGVKLDSL